VPRNSISEHPRSAALGGDLRYRQINLPAASSTLTLPHFGLSPHSMGDSALVPVEGNSRGPCPPGVTEAHRSYPFWALFSCCAGLCPPWGEAAILPILSESEGFWAQDVPRSRLGGNRLRAVGHPPLCDICSFAGPYHSVIGAGTLTKRPTLSGEGRRGQL